MKVEIDEITITINGSQLSGSDGMTILEVAQENGIDIPTLCHGAEFTPIGSCRTCVVEVEGNKETLGNFLRASSNREFRFGLRR